MGDKKEELMLRDEEEVENICEELGLDSKSILISKDGDFVPLDDEVGDSEDLKVHKIIAGG